MHILFVTGEYPPLTGGVGAYTAELAGALFDHGARTSVVTSTRVQPAAATRRGEAQTPVYPVIEGWGPGIWRKVAGLADDLDVDWVHVQYQTAAFAMNPAINFAPDRWRWRKSRHWRTAWTYHDLFVPYLYPKAGRRIRTWVTERPSAAADLTIVTNEGDLMRLVGRVDNLHSVPIGSNIRGVELDREQRTRVRRSFGIADDTPLLGYFGFLNRSKGGMTLIETLHDVVKAGVETHLLMIGDSLGASDSSNRAYLAEVQQRIDALGLANRIRWTGALDDEGVANALNAVDVVFLPYEDGASLRRGTLMAAMANGCAVVTTTPEIPFPELVDGRDLLYVPPTDPVAASNAIRTLFHDAPLRASLGASLRACSENFTWPRIASQHLALYATRRAATGDRMGSA